MLQILNGFLRYFLLVHPLQHVLLSRSVVANGDQHAGCDVTCDGAAEDGGRQGEGSNVVVDSPGARPE